MGRKSRSKLNRMLRAKPATAAPAGRPSDRERMRRVLWKMVERYEQDLTGGETKPMVTGSQAIAAMRMLRAIDSEEAAAEEAAPAEAVWPDFGARHYRQEFTAPSQEIRKEQADAEQGEPTRAA